MSMNLKLFAGLAIAVTFAMPASAADKIKVGLITKFPVPFYSTMEDAAKKYAAAHPEIELVTGQGQRSVRVDRSDRSMIEVKGLRIHRSDRAPALTRPLPASRWFWSTTAFLTGRPDGSGFDQQSNGGRSPENI